MKEVKYFYLKYCPHCRRADDIIEKLKDENPKFSHVKIEKIEETEQRDVANDYDYYLVPCLWVGEEKVMEGVPTEAKVKKALEAALEKE